MAHASLLRLGTKGNNRHVPVVRGAGNNFRARRGGRRGRRCWVRESPRRGAEQRSDDTERGIR
eukprot:13088807-Alexandrium_andersonii.AAC.1